MDNIKARIFALLIILVFAGLMYYNWHLIKTEGTYSTKLAAFGPVGIIGGIFWFLFPDKGGKPDTVKDKIIVLFVFALGIAAGLFNWYLMDPGFFGR